MRAYRASVGASLLALAACVTGCFDDKGLGIEVDVGDNDVDQVELVVALQQPCEEQQIAPTNDTKLVEGPACYRDRAQRLLAKVHGRTATFRLEALTQDLLLQMVVAVGLKQEGDQLTATSKYAILSNITVPKDGLNFLSTTLVDSSANDSVTMWFPPVDTRELDSSCVLITHRDENGTLNRSFIVPREDIDCDGWQNMSKVECNASIPDAQSSNKPSCLTASATTACMIGGAPCKDGAVQNPPGCDPILTPNPTCIPSFYCSDCAQEISVGCFFKNAQAIRDVPHFECMIPTAAPGNRAMCNDKETGGLDLRDPDGLGFTGECDDIQLGDIQQNSFHKTDAFVGTTLKLSRGGGGDKCSFTIEWQAGDHDVTGGDGRGVVQVQTPTNALLIPISFQFAPQSPTDQCAINCQFVGKNTDPMFTSCAAP